MSKESKASDHVKPCNIAQSEAHNRRDTEYIKSLNPSKLYIRTDLSHRNESYVAPGMEGVTLQQHYDAIKAMVKQLTGRAMQEKDILLKNGKTRKGASPIRESVVNIKEGTTMDDLLRYVRAVEKRWGIRAIQIHIHKDEGHYANPDDPKSWEANYHAHIIWDWMDHSTGKSWKLNANDMSELQDMVAETLDMERGASKAETGLDHLERNDFIIQKQKQEMEEAEKAKKNAVLEKKIAEIKTQTALKEKARLDNEIATINEKVIKAQNECDSLDEKYDGLVEKYNSLVNTYNDTLRDLNAWRAAADWQKFMFDTLSETYYQGNEIVKYAVDSLISFAKNDDGRGGHQDFLHDDQSVAIKHTLLMVNASDKSVWQKVAAWLLSLAKRFGNLTVMQLQRASRQLDDVVNGKYDWRISKFMEQHGLSR